MGCIVSSANKTPFLLRSNQYGLVPYDSQLAYLNASLAKDYDSLYTIKRKMKKFGIGYGLESHINLSKNSSFFLPQAYLKFRYGAFQFYGGRRKEIQGLIDTVGTMGSYIWSGNALPMPKIEISIPNFTPILGKGLVAIKGNFAHAWFGKGDSVQNVLLHQKSLYIRIGKPFWKAKMIGGFNHQVQWGGYPTLPFFDKISNQTITKYNNDFSTFIQIATGVSLNKNGDGLQQGTPANEALNRAGNHLGTLDIGFEFDTKLGKLMIYRQNIYEDGSLYYLNNIKDGLFGIAYKPKYKYIKNICVEYLDTRNQGGDGSSSHSINELRGSDNYFNNSIYVDSWTYKAYVIGTPFFSTYSENQKIIKLSKEINSNYIVNNRVRALNINFLYEWKNIRFSSQITKVKNKGSFEYPLSTNQLSLAHSSIFQGKLIDYFIVIASDTENIGTKNIGLNFGIKKHLIY